MIGFLRGEVAAKAQDHVLLDVQGVGYVVYCTESTIGALPGPGAMVILHTEMVVREDLMQLIGFVSQSEREWYRLLTTVQGVGMKAALAILDTLGTEALGRAVTLGDWAALRAAKGVGPKSAQRITHELAEKAVALLALPETPLAVSEPSASASVTTPMPPVVAAEPSPASTPNQDAGAARRDALSALVNLGYSQIEAAQALAALDQPQSSQGVSQLITSALKHLAPKG